MNIDQIATHRTQVLRYLSSRTSGITTEDLEDAFQDVMLDLIMSPFLLDGVEDVPSYVSLMCYNKLMGSMRDKKKSTRNAQEYMLTQDQVYDPTVEGPDGFLQPLLDQLEKFKLEPAQYNMAKLYIWSIITTGKEPILPASLRSDVQELVKNLIQYVRKNK